MSDERLAPREPAVGAPKGRRSPLTEERLRALFLQEGVVAGSLRDRLGNAWRRTLGRLLPLGGVSVSNSLTVHNDGDAAFEAMLGAIDAAERRAWLETYIFEPDALGTRVLEALERAARRGVDVVLLYDAFGSPRLTGSKLRGLTESGARSAAFNPIFGRRRMPLWARDHRKILLCDDVGFAGGMNVSVEYAGPRLGNGRFRDTMAELRGPAVRDLARVFANSWRLATGRGLEVEAGRPQRQPDDIMLQVLSSSLRRERRHLQRALLHTITRSVERCWLTSPYFVPPPRLTRALIHASRRGVDVRVLTAGLSDVPLVRRASQHLYGRLLKKGVRVYEVFGRTLHAKTTTIDGVYAGVGSFNLDFWSFRRMLEVNVSAVDRGVARGLELQFEKDLEMAQEVMLPSWENRSLPARLIDGLAYQLLKL